MANEQNLVPAKKGEVRNPKGRGKGVPNSKTRLLRLLELTQDLKNPVTGEIEGFTVMEQIDMKLIQKARNGDLPAIKELLDRLEGKPQQNIDMNLAVDPRKDILNRYMGDNDVRQAQETESRPSTDPA